MGKFFFIIMNGSVGINTPSSPLLEKRKNSFDNIKLFDKAIIYNENKNKNQIAKSKSIEKNEKIDKNDKIDKNEKNEKNEKNDKNDKNDKNENNLKNPIADLKFEDLMLEVNVLTSGDTFGEYSLINNQPTQASIKCKEDCHFAVLEKKDFNKILSILYNFFLIFSEIGKF